MRSVFVPLFYDKSGGGKYVLVGFHKCGVCGLRFDMGKAFFYCSVVSRVGFAVVCSDCMRGSGAVPVVVKVARFKVAFWVVQSDVVGDGWCLVDPVTLFDLSKSDVSVFDVERVLRESRESNSGVKVIDRTVFANKELDVKQIEKKDEFLSLSSAEAKLEQLLLEAKKNDDEVKSDGK